MDIKDFEARLNELDAQRADDKTNVGSGERIKPKHADESSAELNPSVLLSEASLAADWNRPEEDAAWSNLQREASS